jgi:hypothetical protein
VVGHGEGCLLAALAFAIRTSASSFRIVASFARLAASSAAAKTFLASTIDFTPPTSARISIPFRSSSIEPPLRLHGRVRIVAVHKYSSR